MKNPILRPLRWFALLSFLFSFTAYAQNSKSSASKQNPVTNQTDVYIAGSWYDRKTQQTLAAYFKNGEPIVLRDGQNLARTETRLSLARSIAIDGNDIHVVGNILDSRGRDKAAYWKNQKYIPLPIKLQSNGDSETSYANGIEVSNGNVFIFPYQSGTNYYYLKNGVETNFPYLVNPGQIKDRIHFVSGNDIYLANYADEAAYWKNGVKVSLDNTMRQPNRVQVSSIFVYGSDVYVAGYKSYAGTGSGTNRSMAVYWKNGQEVILSTGSGIYATRLTSSIFVADNDVYVSGMSVDPNTGEPMAVYWKNGQMVILAKGQTFTQALAIAVAGNDVYVAGEHSNYKVYWKNGQEIKLPDCGDVYSIALSNGNGSVPSTTLNNSSSNSTSDLILKEKADQYLAQMRKVPGMIETSSGLLYQVLRAGTGPKVTFEQTIAADYKISFPDGVTRPGHTGGVGGDMSASRYTIKGMQEAVQLMQAGGVYRFIIPYNLVYGKKGSKDIPPYQVFIYDVETFEIEK
ncbi:FKBP-type peptidyl-prolyl cis-trans isomerase [Sphingobacterium sp.]|uniref:FKBP-type peptidyl-prolyl cis-trans isomerase n=1 Tax=Sphingobacterium sp. TaxID=341027 RepID=UPI00258826F3|nr:FKBP-type peptidyl-prolyl cis-trans isomerase [Sphingobacterium sp.]WET67875.1 MAG: FKBP-type peptidyl-prolyl cis-trans isomerase [Sphingobacterium sp.]